MLKFIELMSTNHRKMLKYLSVLIEKAFQCRENILLENKRGWVTFVVFLFSSNYSYSQLVNSKKKHVPVGCRQGFLRYLPSGNHNTPKQKSRVNLFHIYELQEKSILLYRYLHLQRFDGR